MPGKAAKVTMTERQQEILRTMSRSRMEAAHFRQRAQIILLAFDRQRNEDIAAQVGLERHQVGSWRRRWADAFERLVRRECVEGVAALKKAIRQVLSDAPRSGAPGKFTAEQLAQIIAVACEPPEDSGRPVTHWNPAELAAEVVQRGIVPSISATTVRQLLQEADLKPHRSRYWLHSKDKTEDPEGCVTQVQSVCACYLNAAKLYWASHTHTVSLDEINGIQARERIAPDRGMKPGQVALREFEYKRHGTVTLIGNLHVVTGQVLTPTLGPTRTEQDFVQHVERTLTSDPEAAWVFVCDQRNIHGSESLVRFVARQCGIPGETLGVKGKSGVLKSTKTRKAFLSAAGHRVRFVYTPRHTSWLNQIEIWFSILVRRVLKRGSFASVEALGQRIVDSIDYFNRTLAKPFRWTYTGRPLQARVQ